MTRTPELPGSLGRWAPPPRRVRYARVGRAGDIALHRVLIEEDWGPLQQTEAGLEVRRTTRDITAGPEAPPRVLEDALVGYTAEGLVDLGLFEADGGLRRWHPPQVVLPAEPAAGATWTGTHRRGEVQSSREVSIQACTEHKGCLVSVAEVRRPGGVLVLRMHFAGGDGFQGYEALVHSQGGPPVRMWTEALTVQRRAEGGEE